MKLKNYIACLTLIIGIMIITGCEEKRKALVSAHTAVGELLLSTKDQANFLHKQKAINDETYKSIRTNWLRAQISYVQASDILERILSTNTQDITPYTELITQVSIILSDITLWMEEDKHEPTGDNSISNSTPTPHYEVSGGNSEGAGTERIGQGSTETNRAGDEGQSVGSNVGELLNTVSIYTVMFKDNEFVSINSIANDASKIDIKVITGSIRYTFISDSGFSIKDTYTLRAGENIVFDWEKGKKFIAFSSSGNTQLSISVSNKIDH